MGREFVEHGGTGEMDAQNADAFRLKDIRGIRLSSSRI